jgi:hypothetical protein
MRKDYIMKNLNLKEIGTQSMDSTKEKIRLGLKSLQSDKYKLKKMKDEYPLDKYEIKMIEILKDEQILKEMRNFLNPKKITYKEMTIDMIWNLSLDEVNHGLKSLQSAKSMNKFNLPMKEEIESKELEFIQRRNELKGNGNSSNIKKSKIEDLLENLSLLSKDDKILEMERRIKELMKG